MTNVLNFNKSKKQYMTVVLPGEKKTVLMIGTPTKNIMDELLSLGKNINGAEMNEDVLDDLYVITSKIMNRNKTGVKITTEKLGELLDFDDILSFIRGYTEFIQGVTESKN